MIDLRDPPPPTRPNKNRVQHSRKLTRSSTQITPNLRPYSSPGRRGGRRKRGRPPLPGPPQRPATPTRSLRICRCRITRRRTLVRSRPAASFPSGLRRAPFPESGATSAYRRRASRSLSFSKSVVTTKTLKKYQCFIRRWREDTGARKGGGTRSYQVRQSKLSEVLQICLEEKQIQKGFHSTMARSIRGGGQKVNNGSSNRHCLRFSTPVAERIANTEGFIPRWREGSAEGEGEQDTRCQNRNRTCWNGHAQYFFRG